MFDSSRWRSLSGSIAELRPFVWFAIVLFLVGAALGMLFPGVSIERLDVLKQLAEQLRGESAGVLIAAIFLKNATATAMSILLGVAFGIVPMFGALANGLLLGALALINPGGLWRIIPHGVFELPAVFIAWGTGIWVGLWFRASEPLATLGTRLRKGAAIFLTVIVPLLLIAAVIEGVAAARLWRG